MDPIKRHQYDMDLSGTNYTFTQDDYDNLKAELKPCKTISVE